MKFDELPDEQQDWVDAYLDGSIGTEAFDALQAELLRNPQLRAVMRRYLSIDHSLQLAAGDATPESFAAKMPWAEISHVPKSNVLIRFVPIAVAAALAFTLGSIVMYLVGSREGEVEVVEQGGSAKGFAVVGQLFDVEWPDGEAGSSEGDRLGAETFRLISGTAAIQFFSGANMIVEGPAEISLTSAWEATCRDGAVRVQVPPAARGFKLHAPQSEIIDLGTEFGLVVRDGEAHVEVFDGEISVRHEGGAETSVKEGGAFALAVDQPMVAEARGAVKFPNGESFGVRSNELLRADFERWQAYRDSLPGDGRLLAYYTFDRADGSALLPNLAIPRNPDLDGAVILAESVAGRWDGMKSALEFRRPGSRVRVNLPGEFPALTFTCWVRIDSLDRRYSALFMGDGYENGEPHWQIQDDGKMMLSVMVDEDGAHPRFPKSRFHQVYFSPPIWDLSMSGEWLHLASVYDPASRSVSHYVNGERISRQAIEPEFVVSELRIGNGEIGNWGQPFRTDPTFAIRNLNGRMDEVAIFKAALGDAEIAEIYERSRARR